SHATELFQELVRRGSDPAKADHIVAYAASFGRDDVLRYLHGKGFETDQPNPNGIRPLQAAVGVGSLDSVRFLLECSADAAQIDLSQPLNARKGIRTDEDAMEKIRALLQAKQAE